MATHAVFWRRFEEDNHTPVYFLPAVVTILAGDALMRALQRKTRSLMIEFAGLPFRVVVTGRAALTFGHTGELAGMHILVATGAGERRALKDELADAEGKGVRAVTLLAGCGAVRSGEREAGLIVIEACRLAPRANVVAGIAGCGHAGRLHLRAFAHFGLVGILVATGAAQVSELIGRGVMLLGLVAIAAGNRNVRAFQGKARLIVA